MLPVHCARLLIALRVEQHISLSKQLFRSVHINDRPGINTGRARKMQFCDGIFALISPVMTFTDGRCVARIR